MRDSRLLQAPLPSRTHTCKWASVNFCILKITQIALRLGRVRTCILLSQSALRFRERLRTHSIESSGKLKISPEQHWDFTAEDLKDLGEIGRGAYGSVNKMVHKPSGQIMAVKVTRKPSQQKVHINLYSVCVSVCMTVTFVLQRIRSTVDEKEQKQLLMDLDVVMRSSDCPYIVQFYGALFREVSFSFPSQFPYASDPRLHRPLVDLSSVAVVYSPSKRNLNK